MAKRPQSRDVEASLVDMMKSQFIPEEEPEVESKVEKERKKEPAPKTRKSKPKKVEKKKEEVVMSKVSLDVNADHWNALYNKAGESKSKSSRGVTRVGIIRSLIEAFLDVNPSIKSIDSEEELVTLLKKKLK